MPGVPARSGGRAPRGCGGCGPDPSRANGVRLPPANGLGGTPLTPFSGTSQNPRPSNPAGGSSSIRNNTGRPVISATLRPAPPPVNPAWTSSAPFLTSATAINTGAIQSNTSETYTFRRVASSASGFAVAPSRHPASALGNRLPIDTSGNMNPPGGGSNASDGGGPNPGIDCFWGENFTPWYGDNNQRAGQGMPKVGVDIVAESVTNPGSVRGSQGPVAAGPGVVGDGVGTRSIRGSEVSIHPENPDPTPITCYAPSTLSRVVLNTSRDRLANIQAHWNIGRLQYVAPSSRNFYTVTDVHAQLVKAVALCNDLREENARLGGEWSRATNHIRRRAEGFMQAVAGWLEVIDRREKKEEARKQVLKEAAKEKKIRLMNRVATHERCVTNSQGQQAGPFAAGGVSGPVGDVQNDSGPSRTQDANSHATAAGTNNLEEDGLKESARDLRFQMDTLRPYWEALNTENNQLRLEASQAKFPLPAPKTPKAPTAPVVERQPLDLLTDAPEDAQINPDTSIASSPKKLTRYTLRMIEREGRVDMIARELQSQAGRSLPEDADEAPSPTRNRAAPADECEPRSIDMIAREIHNQGRLREVPGGVRSPARNRAFEADEAAALLIDISVESEAGGGYWG
ncbi:hypothetical protein P152DRAFT_516363 [Eremomyces bilateralis CBS 781.70]|uniref:Uncharacterized protein n=1 Tax=Eremomyces bilateralis CBS 781.70 TaxID=1392243 RepID=A0A6G1FW76_9PEZI|nr:uncharacterized protein P152DRAFT_516363 [Eremomyces bilateralis CBS 781.70]KAF1809946.1 hypothetical protein P152DRAFT_516363 [Eremomyces bilateralis CBS 781.70]